jgi:membrane protein YdbS with pleckstrin-like domain
LEKDVKEKVIKPPIKRVTSGKIFKPSKAFLRKNLLQPIVLAVTIWLFVVICFVGGSFIGAAVEPEDIPSATQHIATWIVPVSFWTAVVNLVWLIPLLIYIPYEYRSIEYSVKAETGETMPEIYVKRGVVTVSRKHVPFRTITNISSKAGAFDRLFNIGSVHIETAGYSGSHQTGPEVKLEGIVFYEEVRDFILNELRKFKAPYVTGTEVVPRIEEPVPATVGLDDEILITLREIRDILKNQKTQK